MCNDYAKHVAYGDYRAAFAELKILGRFPKAAPNLEPRDDIRPTDMAPLLCATDDGPEFTQLRWEFPPAKAKGLGRAARAAYTPWEGYLLHRRWHPCSRCSRRMVSMNMASGAKVTIAI